MIINDSLVSLIPSIRRGILGIYVTGSVKRGLVAFPNSQLW